MSGGECKCKSKCIAWICSEEVRFWDCLSWVPSVPVLNFPNWKAMRLFQFCKCKKVALSFRLKLPPSANLAGCPDSAVPAPPYLTHLKRHIRLNDLKRKRKSFSFESSITQHYSTDDLHSWVLQYI